MWIAKAQLVFVIPESKYWEISLLCSLILKLIFLTDRPMYIVGQSEQEKNGIESLFRTKT